MKSKFQHLLDSNWTILPIVIFGYAACLVGTSIALFSTQNNDIGVGFQDFEANKIFPFFSLPFVMILGILAKEVQSKIHESVIPDDQDIIDIKRVFWLATRSTGFWRGVLVSPIVFASVYLVIQDQPDVVINHLLSFENGFFWSAVLEKRRG